MDASTSSCPSDHDRADPQMSDGGVGLRIDGCAGKDFSRGLIAPVLCVLACLVIDFIGKDIFFMSLAVCDV